MNRNELKTIAEGFKRTRPVPHVNSPAWQNWRDTVRSVANALGLEENPKALSNFYAACGWLRDGQTS